MALTSFTDGVTTVTADWLNKVFGDNGHVHDGADDDGSAPKVNIKDHIDYDADDDGSKEGEMEAVTDSSSLHEIIYRHLGSGFTRFIADRFRAAGAILEGDNGGSGVHFDFRDASNPGTPGSAEMQAKSLTLSDLLSAVRIKPSGAVSEIDVEGAAGNSANGFFRAKTAPIGYGMFRFDGSTWPKANTTFQIGAGSQVSVGEHFFDITDANNNKFTFNNFGNYSCHAQFVDEDIDTGKDIFWMARPVMQDDGSGNARLKVRTYKVNAGTVTLDDPGSGVEMQVIVFRNHP